MVFKPAQVHFILGSHEDYSEFSFRKEPFPKTKTIIIEAAEGIPLGINVEKYLPRVGIEGEARPHTKSTLEYLKNAQKRGIKIIGGEQTYNSKESAKLTFLYRQFKFLRKQFEQSMAFEPYLQFMQTFGELQKFREELILRTIKDSLKHGNVEVRFGTAHDTLRRELIRQGIRCTREVLDLYGNTPLNVQNQIFKKIMHGKKPAMDEYKRAYINEVLFVTLRRAIPYPKQVQGMHSKQTYLTAVIQSINKKMSHHQVEQVVQFGEAGMALVLTEMQIPFFERYSLPSKFAQSLKRVISERKSGKRLNRLVDAFSKAERKRTAITPRTRH
jgi:hypothetical protein